MYQSASAGLTHGDWLGKNLPPAVVEAAFRWSLEHDMPLAAFLGDACVTLKQTPELQATISSSRILLPHMS